MSLSLFSAGYRRVEKKSFSCPNDIEEIPGREMSKPSSRAEDRLGMLKFYIRRGLWVIMQNIEDATSFFKLMKIEADNTANYDGTALKRALIPPSKMKEAVRFMWNRSVAEIPEGLRDYYKRRMKNFFDLSKKDMTDQEKRRAGSLNLHLFQSGVESGYHPHHAPIYTRIVDDMGSAYFWRYAVKETASSKEGPESDLVDDNLIKLETGNIVIMTERYDAHQASIIGYPNRDAQVATVSYFGEPFSDPHPDVPDVSSNDHFDDAGMVEAFLREYRPHYLEYRS